LADTIYWNEYSSDNRIRHAPLAGGGTVDTLYGSMQGVASVRGLSIDPAAGRIYWNNGDLTIRRAPLDGSGPATSLYSGIADVNGAGGLAIDPAAGWIYWGNPGDRTIRRAPLDGSGPVGTLYTGSGTGSSGTQALYAPTALAIDPAARRIYWCDSAISVICGAPLDGSGPVVPLYKYTDGVKGPFAVAVDPTEPLARLERVVDTERATIGRRLGDLFPTSSRPQTRIYWTNWDMGTGAGIVCAAPLDGSGPVNTLYDRTRGVSSPTGVAIDPDPTVPELARLEPEVDTERFSVGRWLRDLFSISSRPPARLYWANAVSPPPPGGTPNPSDRTIRRAPLDGSGPFDPLYSAAQGYLPGVLALLRAPVGTLAPTISWSFVLDAEEPFGDWHFGGGHSGPPNRDLTCSPGIWAPDLPSYHLYRGPKSFAYQWRRDGTDIGGATSDHYTASSPGSYTCQVTATNHAGSAAQTSPPVTIYGQ
jgi:hypothetical protein